MDNLKNFVKRYNFSLILVGILIVISIFSPSIGKDATLKSLNSIKEVLKIIPPVFILLGLLDVWVKRETMMKYMGEEAGFKGVLIAFFLGSAAAGPLYAAFPVAGVLLKKGSKLSNIFVFIGAWSTTKIPMLLMEATYMGTKFTIIRLILSIIGIGIITIITEKSLNPKDKDEIFKKAIMD